MEKGYRVVEVSDLRFDFMGLRRHLPEGYSFALDTAPGSAKLYFPLDDQDNRLYFIHLPFQKIENVSACAALEPWIKTFKRERAYIHRAVRFFPEQKNLGLAMLNTERAYFELRKVIYEDQKPEETEKSYALLLSVLRKTQYERLAKLKKEPTDELGIEEFKYVLSGLRLKIFEAGLKNYLSAQSSLTHFFSERWANCSGQTKLLVALYHDLGLTPPKGWRFGAEEFNDHIRPVLYNESSGELIDLVYNKVARYKKSNPIFTPTGILRAMLDGIRSHQPGLFFSGEYTGSKNSEVYYNVEDPPQDLFKNFLGAIGLGGSPEPQKAEVYANYPGDFPREALPESGLTTENFAPPGFENPKTDDLSASMTEGYSQEKERTPVGDRAGDETRAGGVPKKGDGFTTSQSFRVNPEDLKYLNAQDQAAYRRILKDMRMTDEDLERFSTRQFMPTGQCKDYVDDELMPVIKVTLAQPQAGGPTKYSLTTFGSLYNLTVYDQNDYDFLVRAGQKRRYEWVRDQMALEVQTYIDVHYRAMVDFLRSSKPLEHWKSHSRQLLEALQFVSILENRNQGFPWAKCGIVPMLVYANPGFNPTQFELARALPAVDNYFSENHRTVLAEIGKWDRRAISDLFRFFSAVRENLGYGFFAVTPDYVLPNVLLTLLDRMLFDPDFLYTAKLDEEEKQMLKEFSPPVNKKTGPDIHLPQLPEGVHVDCPEEGGTQALGFLMVECKPKAAYVPGSPVFREVREVDPAVLVGLMKALPDEILKPSRALMIFNAWRRAHDELLKGPARQEAETVVIRKFTLDAMLEKSMVDVAHEDACLACSKDLRPLPEGLGTFWSYLDGLLAPNMPSVLSSLARGKRLTWDSSVIQDAVRRAELRDRPEWLEDSELLNSAYDFYGATRPADKRIRLELISVLDKKPNMTWEAYVAKLPGYPDPADWIDTMEMALSQEMISAEPSYAGDGRFGTPSLLAIVKEGSYILPMTLQRFGAGVAWIPLAVTEWEPAPKR